MIKVGIVGVTGYTGLELLRILKNHPEVELTLLTSRTFSGKTLEEVLPFTLESKKLERLDFREIAEKCDVVFTALPSGFSYEIVKQLGDDVKVIDLGADFRFDNPQIYQRWYSKELTGYKKFKRVYGLPEIYREKIKSARIVGNPGCYPTSVLLALAPLLKNNLLADEIILVDSKSGVSGAGKKAAIEYSFSEISGGLGPYNVIEHRHVPEMEQEISKLSDKKFRVIFTPNLVPMVRGILSTVYVKSTVSLNDAYEVYKDFYSEERFVHVLEPKIYPSTKWVYGSNHAFISLAKDTRTDVLILISVIDNLVKGASGQAVQNMNIMFSLPEEMGLSFNPIYP